MKTAFHGRILQPISNKLKLDQFKPSLVIKPAQNKLMRSQSTFQTNKSIWKKNLNEPHQQGRNKKRTVTFHELEQKKKGFHLLRSKSESKSLVRIGSTKKNITTAKKNNIDQSFEKSGSNHLQKFELLQKERESINIEIFFSEIVSKMVKRKDCSVNGETILIKKERMKIFFQDFLGQILNSIKMEEFNKSSSQFSTINGLFRQIQKNCRGEKLTLSTEQISLKIAPQNSDEWINNGLENDIENNNLSLHTVSEILINDGTLIQEQKLSRIQNQNLKELIKEQTQLLITLEQKIKELTAFIENQDAKPIQIEIREDKKVNEAEIYSFAKEVLRKADASPFAWQPYTGLLVEEFVLDDLDNLSSELMKEGVSQKINCDKIREFLRAAIWKFQRKDREMTQAVDEKAEAVRVFLEKLKGYLWNIENKRDFLRNLRKEFAAKSFKVQQALRKLAHSGLNENQGTMLKGLFKLWKEVSQSHKSGTLFF